MPAKQLPINLKVLRVIANRYKWLLVLLTFLSFACSAVITRSMVNVYSSNITVFVDPGNVLGSLAKGVAVASSLGDQLATLRHLVLNNDFIEPHVIQELNIRLTDVYVPPFRLQFMPKILETADSVKNMLKVLFGFEVYTLNNEQKQAQQQLELTNIIKKNITLRQSRGRFLAIAYTGPNPTASKEIVEILANECKELLLRGKNKETREALRYIERQYTEATQRLEELERELADLRVAQFDKGPAAKISLLSRRQESLDSLRRIEKSLGEIQVSKESLMTDQDIRRQELLSSDPEIIEKLSQLAKTQEANELAARRARLKSLQMVYTDEWPEIIELKEQITTLEEAIESRVKEADDKAQEKIFLADPIYNEYFRQLKQLETEEKRLNTNAKNLQDNVEFYETKIKEMPEIEKSFGAIQRKIGLHSKLQMDLASKRETARATMELEKTRGEDRIRIVGRSSPTKPVGGSPLLMMIGICLVGPMTGTGIIFLLYYLNTSVKSPEDVQVEYNLPVIAVIPKTNFKRELQRYKKLKRIALTLQKQRRGPKKLKQRTPQLSSKVTSPVESSAEIALQEIETPEVELFGKIVKRVPAPLIQKTDDLLMVTMLTNPKSQAAEEYRRLCFNVEWGLKEALSGPCRAIMVTSALPSEGKTITAINLATTLARNHKVLLIDANFRRPSVHRVFGTPQEFGLSDMLENNATPQLFIPSENPNLSLLPAGIALGHPADLLSSKPMHYFIESVKSSSYFEYAIFDVPPVSLIPDASIIASKLDGIVWVIWELGTAKEIVRLALSRVTNPAILGVVLNRSEQHVLPRRYDKVWKGYQRPSLKKTRKRV